MKDGSFQWTTKNNNQSFQFGNPNSFLVQYVEKLVKMLYIHLKGMSR